jgi:ADP-L-glycero-D-manno-heptose 6-epimerase
MASMVTQIDRQLSAGGPAVLFGASHGCAAGEHSRDFVHVDDVVDTICWFRERPEVSGIFNCGTGESRTFKQLAEAVIGVRGGGAIEFKEMPSIYSASYQASTRADLRRLRAAGCDTSFRPLEVGVVDVLGASSGAPRR